MGNRHPLKAAKIGQITGGGGWVGVKERRGRGPFSYSLPSRVCKMAASPHNLALTKPFLLPAGLRGTSVLFLKIS